MTTGGRDALERTSSLPEGPSGSWLALPPGRPPRVLVERTHLAEDPGALRDVIGHTGLLRRASTAAAAAALAAGAHRLLPDRPDWARVARRLVGLARDVADAPDARGIIRVSPSRPNSKPVVQLLDRDHGTTLAWVKVGWDQLTRELVQRETAVLHALEPPPRLEVPPVLGVREGEVAALALGPLATDPGTRRAGTPQLLAEAALAVFGEEGFGRLGGGRLGEVPVLVAETGSLAGLTGPVGRALQARTREFTDRYGDLEVATGRWHGDWNLANAALASDHVAAWDWERSSEGAPLGLDAAFALMFLLPPATALEELAALLPDAGPRRVRAMTSLAALCAAARHAELEALGVQTRSSEAIGRLDAHLRP